MSVTPDGGRAFVAAGITVSAIDLNSRLGAGSILMQGTPLAVAVSPDGNTVYAARKGAIETIDVPAMIRTGERALSGTPIALAVTATRAIEVQQGGKVAIVDLTTGRLVRRIKLDGAAGVALDKHGRAWVSATTPRKGKRKAASRIVRIEPASGAISGSVALGTDGGGGLGISPDATKAIVAPGAKLPRASPPQGGARRPRPPARDRPPADRRRARPGDLLDRRHAPVRHRQRPQDARRSSPRRPPTACARSPSRARRPASSSSPAWRC